MNSRTVHASNFVGTIAANANSDKLTDAEFRAFIRNSLPIVVYDSGMLEEFDTKHSDGTPLSRKNFNKE
jgi:hypothetical protein